MALLVYKCLSQKAQPPRRATPGSAGLDLHSVKDIIILPQTGQFVNTGLGVEFPPTCFGHVAPRSGLTYKHSLHVAATLAYNDVNVPIVVHIFNTGTTPYQIKVGDRIAQLVCTSYQPIVCFEEVCFDDPTIRNQCGFGSSGQ